MLIAVKRFPVASCCFPSLRVASRCFPCAFPLLISATPCVWTPVPFVPAPGSVRPEDHQTVYSATNVNDRNVIPKDNDTHVGFYVTNIYFYVVLYVYTIFSYLYFRHLHFKLI